MKTAYNKGIERDPGIAVFLFSVLASVLPRPSSPALCMKDIYERH